MPAKKKDVKHDEPVFVDSEGVFIHEAEQARYSGGVRTLTSGVLPASMIANNPSLASVINNINNNNGSGGMLSGEADKTMQGGGSGGGGKGNSPAKKSKNKSTPASSSTVHNSGDNKLGNAASSHLTADGSNNINNNKGNDGAGNMFVVDNVLRFRHGTGTYISPQLRYCGEWKEDVMHGNGTLEFKKSGATYTGAFVNGMFCGHGKYMWADGSCYDGLWANNKMHGQGTFTDEHGQI